MEGGGGGEVALGGGGMSGVERMEGGGKIYVQ